MSSGLEIDQRHPDYTAVDATRTEAIDWWLGADAIKDKDEIYLIKGENEKQSKYDIRLQLAPVDPLAEIIVETRQGILHRKEHDRSGVKAPSTFRDNVDMAGTPDHVFFQQAGRDAQVSGMDWILTSRIGAADAGEITRQQERELGLRGFFEHIPGANVLNWGQRNGQLTFATYYRAVREEGSPKRPWEKKPTFPIEWVTFTPSEWIIYRKDKAGNFSITANGTHPVRRVPLTPVYGARASNFKGWPVFRRSIPHMKTLYNLWSELIWFLRISGHPIPMFTGAEKIEILDSGLGGWIKQTQDDPRPTYGYLEPKGPAHDAMAKTISDLTRRVYAIELRQSLNESRQVASADTRREDKQSLNSSLKVAAYRLEAAEKECWDNLARWNGDYSDSTEIEYHKDFDDAAIEAAFVKELGGLVRDRVVSAETVRSVLMRGEILPHDLDQDEEKKRIEDEADNISMPGFGQGDRQDLSAEAEE